MEKKERKEILSMQEETRVFPPPENIKKTALIKTLEEYKQLYKKSVDDPDGFWAEQAKELEWFKKWDKVSE